MRAPHALVVRRIPALLCAALAGLAAASAPASADEELVTGFTTYGSGELTGVATTTDGKPLAGATVHIAPASGAPRQVVTDKQGRYRATIKDGGAYTMVFVKGAARLGGQISVPTQLPDGGEAIEIHETLPPAVMPKPLGKTWLVPEYSAAAKEKGAWARAWLMLDIDEQGSVSRLKLLAKPGLDLDPIAIRDAFKLRFEPARDRAGRATHALVLWSYEWPSYWWLTERKLPTDRITADVEKVPCRGAGGTHKYYRDCSRVDVSKGMSEPWIDRPKR